MAVGQASDKFRNSSIPTQLFWPYIYASSPLANLQLNVRNRNVSESPANYAVLEYLPDFVSKRLVSADTIERSAPSLISEQLTVSTMYGRAFFLMGWTGLCLNFIYFIFVSLVCLRILSGSKYFVTGNATLTSLAFLGIFDNMFVVAGGILQVLIAIGLSLLLGKSYPAK